MEATGETCKLCLKYIQGPSLAVLDENLLSKLEFLQMDLDQSVEESNSVCKECEEKIESAFDFKSCIVPSGSEEQTQKGTNDPSTSTGESSAEKAICHLCKNSVNATAVISLPKVLKDDSMMEVFQGHIPEMDLEGIENKMVCDACQKSLASFSTLIASWSIANGWNDDEDMKEDFDDFEMVQVKKEGFDELSDSNTNSSMGNNEVGRGAKSLKKTKSKNGQATVVKIKTEGDGLSDSCESASVNEKDIKKEPEGGAEMEDLQLKSEEVDIKPEDEDGSRKRKGKQRKEAPSKDKTGLTTPFLGLPVYRYKKSKRKREQIRKRKELEYKYKCSQCTYETCFSSYFERHKACHENKGMNRCTFCNERFERHCDLRKHKLIHLFPNEIPVYKCEYCIFQTNFKNQLKAHSITHKNLNEIEIFKCELCSFQTRYGYNLKKHVATHSNEDIIPLKCDKCSFQTKYRGNLNYHYRQKHEPKIEVETVRYQCLQCAFQTKWKQVIKKHEKCHTRVYENIVSYRCDQCCYITSTKSAITKHYMRHKTPDTVAPNANEF